MKTIVLINLGGPASLPEVKNFLQNLFDDPCIFNLGKQGSFLSEVARKWLAKFIIWKRLDRVEESYAQIGGASPLPLISHKLVLLLQQYLANIPHQQTREQTSEILAAMRYSHPSIEEVLLSISADRDVLLLPLFPQHCSATTGSALCEVQQVIDKHNLAFRSLTSLESFPTNPHFIKAWLNNIVETLAAKPYKPNLTTVIFCAHGIPAKLVREGDRYEKEVHATVQALVAKLPAGLSWQLAFQSKVGPLRWLGPDVRQVVAQLAQVATKEGTSKERTLLVVPISFVIDNLETCYELDNELQVEAAHLGLTDFRRVPCLNTQPLWVECLAELVKTKAN